MSQTWSNVAGSIPLPNGLPLTPSTLAWDVFSGETVCTPGTRFRASPVCGLIGENPSLFSTTI